MSKRKNGQCPNRRQFLKKSAAVGAGIGLGAPAFLDHKSRSAHAAPAQEWAPKGKTPKGKHDLVVARGDDPAEMVEKAVGELGGFEEFIQKGDNVLIKPNIGWDRKPEQAANTNPDLVGRLITMCRRARAKSITILDNTVHSSQQTYRKSGIQDAAEKFGARMVHLGGGDYVKVRMGGEKYPEWEAVKSYPEFDKVINCPIAKHHSKSRLTMCMKNYFGLVGGNRGGLHQFLDDAIAELTKFFCTVRPTLHVLDAYRILLRNGPVGGKLADVAAPHGVVAGWQPASVDAYGATFFQLKPSEIAHIRAGEKLGLGGIDLEKLKIRKIEV